MQRSIPEGERLFSNRALASLIIPLVIEQFLAMLIGTTASMMVSSISEAAVSAISLVDSVNILFIQLFSAMGAGGAIVAAQYLGKHEALNACNAAKQLLHGSLLISLMVAAVSCAFCEPLLRLCFGNLDPVTMQYSRTFFYLSALSYPAMALYNGSAALMRAMGNGSAPMFASLLMNVLNIALSALMIYGLGMGVAGAGWAALIGRIAGALVITRLLINPGGRIHLIRPFHFELDKEMLKRIFRIGVPNGLENSIFQVGKLLVAGIVATYGVSMIAANAIVNNIIMLFSIPGSAIGLSIIAVIGQSVGAGDARQARYYTVKLIKLSYLILAPLNLILFFAARPIAMLYPLSAEAIDVAADLLRWCAAFTILFWTTSFLPPCALRAAGDAKFTMFVSVLSMWICRVALSYLLAYTFDLKLLGVWLAMFFDWIVRSACFLWRYKSGKWLQKRVV